MSAFGENAERPTAPASPDVHLDAIADRARGRALRVGALVVLSLVVLLGVLVVTGPLRLLSGRRLSVDFAWAGPVKPGATVRVAGIVVGAVEGVDFLAGHGGRISGRARKAARL